MIVTEKRTVLPIKPSFCDNAAYPHSVGIMFSLNGNLFFTTYFINGQTLIISVICLKSKGFFLQDVEKLELNLRSSFFSIKIMVYAEFDFLKEF